jgi:hypothetical protein
MFALLGQITEAMEHFDPEQMKGQIQTVVDNVADMHQRMIRIEAKLDLLLDKRGASLMIEAKK